MGVLIELEACQPIVRFGLFEQIALKTHGTILRKNEN